MRKNIVFALCAIAMMVTLTACGNEGTTSAYTTEYRNDDQQVTTSVSDENPANVDNSGHEPDSYKSGNFQDYWEGDSYFDIEGFAMDNGCDRVFWYDADGNKCDKSSANACEVVFFYGDWYIAVYPGQIQARNQNTNKTHEMVSNYTGTENRVSVCNENSFTIFSDVCQGFNDILEEIKSN